LEALTLSHHLDEQGVDLVDVSLLIKIKSVAAPFDLALHLADQLVCVAFERLPFSDMAQRAYIDAYTVVGQVGIVQLTGSSV